LRHTGGWEERPDRVGRRCHHIRYPKPQEGERSQGEQRQRKLVGQTEQGAAVGSDTDAGELGHQGVIRPALAGNDLLGVRIDDDSGLVDRQPLGRLLDGEGLFGGIRRGESEFTLQAFCRGGVC